MTFVPSRLVEISSANEAAIAVRLRERKDLTADIRYAVLSRRWESAMPFKLTHDNLSTCSEALPSAHKRSRPRSFLFQKSGSALGRASSNLCELTVNYNLTLAKLRQWSQFHYLLSPGRTCQRAISRRSAHWTSPFWHRHPNWTVECTKAWGQKTNRDRWSGSEST